MPEYKNISLLFIHRRPNETNNSVQCVTGPSGSVHRDCVRKQNSRTTAATVIARTCNLCTAGRKYLEIVQEIDYTDAVTVFAQVCFYPVCESIFNPTLISGEFKRIFKAFRTGHQNTFDLIPVSKSVRQITGLKTFRIKAIILGVVPSERLLYTWGVVLRSIRIVC